MNPNFIRISRNYNEICSSLGIGELYTMEFACVGALKNVSECVHYGAYGMVTYGFLFHVSLPWFDTGVYAWEIKPH